MLFFPRLRRQAKWVFLVLAFVFAAGFVFFGVGSGSTGIGDLFQGNTTGKAFLYAALGAVMLCAAAASLWLLSQEGRKGVKIVGAIIFAAAGFTLIANAANQKGTSQIASLQKQVAKNPKGADDWKKLGLALQTAGRTDEAIDAMNHYTKLKPKDATGWELLANLYLTQARTYYDQYQAVQSEIAALPGAGIGIPPSSFLAKDFEKNPIYQQISQDLQKRASDIQTKLLIALSSRESAYGSEVKALAAGDPSLPTTLFRWAQAATDAQDYKTALKAYERYLKIAPEGSLASDARKAIKQLKELIKAQKQPPAGGK